LEHRLNDKIYGPCRSQEHALDVALSAAQKAHGRGAHAHVMVRESAGYVRCGATGMNSARAGWSVRK
jgi:hypothetical protein